MKVEYREAELEIVKKSAKFLESLGVLEIVEYSHPLQGNQTMIKVNSMCIDVRNILDININFYANVILISTNSSYGNVSIPQFMDDPSTITLQTGGNENV